MQGLYDSIGIYPTCINYTVDDETSDVRTYIEKYKMATRCKLQPLTAPVLI